MAGAPPWPQNVPDIEKHPQLRRRERRVYRRMNGCVSLNEIYDRDDMRALGETRREKRIELSHEMDVTSKRGMG